MTDEQLLRALHPSPETAWPRWWKPKIVCPKCGERNTLMVALHNDFVWCESCDGRDGKRVHRSKFPERICYTGPPLLSPTASLDALLEVADKVAWLGVDIVWVNSQMLFACRFSDRAGELCVGTGTTRREAVQHALLAAAKGGAR
jgi:hypothetical protein